MMSLTFALLLATASASPSKTSAKPEVIPGKADPCTIVRVVDGDTADVLVRGKTERLRLLAIDTEESWPSPGKPVTPFGLETSKWAKGFLASEEPCWVEYGPERRDVYDRLLAYLWRQEGKTWTMYNLQSVERGYSPYFSKYGYSEKHHERFVAAEKRAQKANKGIWDPSNEADLRGKYLGEGGLRPWWDERAESLKAWAAIGAKRRDIIDTRTRWDEARAKSGARVTLFTSIRQPDESGGRWVGKCEGKLYEPLEILAKDGDTEIEKALRASVGKYRYFTGVVELAEDGKTLRLTIDDGSDVRASAPAPAKSAARPK